MTESALSFGAGLLDPAAGFGRGGLGRLSATQTRALRRVIELLTKVLPGLRRGNACLQVLDEHVEDVPDRHLGLDKGFQTLMHTLKLLRNSLRRSTALINEAVNELALFGCDAGWQLALSGLGRLGHRDAQGWDQAAAELLRSVSIGGFPSIADPKITVKTRVCNER